MLAIVPARGGSKGLPGKNIRMMNGKPMIAHTIEAAKLSKEISKIIVSTDCLQIADVAINYGAQVPFLRPDYLASDQSLVLDTYLYILDELFKQEKIKIEEFCVLLPTSPLRGTDDIDNAIRIFREKKADSVVSYTKESHPLRWHKKINSQGALESIFNDELRNRQDEDVYYYPNGAIYIFKEKLLRSGTYYSQNSYPYVMPRERSVDVDDLFDFQFAEYLLRKES